MGENMVVKKQTVLKEYASGYPKESDMVTQVSRMSLNMPHWSNGIVVKNLYLSCDPFILSRMTKSEGGDIIDSLTTGQGVELAHPTSNVKWLVADRLPKSLVKSVDFHFHESSQEPSLAARFLPYCPKVQNLPMCSCL
ncbi:hypothetical protein POM88_019065 [Heracleum sosnowskyi]|uniref:Oxidoreductase N-terminal domain-containing protein n=1 Tax=Heracleum sosnowskyi TaxID=360622 RepID=A0AAD8MZT2_9APIA|nr:hypothetical protein POM88_019064 [Heracleum sosnowskyi]KAK1390887.1 hypothetical protein POM88_019065 [Heracleum sosnowskyi]